MRIPFRYQYKDYPGAPELTLKSQRVGYFTALPGYIIFGFLWLIVVFGVLESMGIDEDAAMWTTLLSGIVALPLIFKKVRANTEEKLSQKYIAKLNVMRDTDPVQYMQIVQELQKRQNTK